MTINIGKQLATRFVEAFNGGDYDALAALCTADFRWIIPGTAAFQSALMKNYPMATPAANKWLQEMIGAFRYSREACSGSMSMSISRMIADGDDVVVEARSQGLIARNGRTYANHYLMLMTITDDRIAALTEYQDTLHSFDAWIAP